MSEAISNTAVPKAQPNIPAQPIAQVAPQPPVQAQSSRPAPPPQSMQTPMSASQQAAYLSNPAILRQQQALLQQKIHQQLMNSMNQQPSYQTLSPDQRQSVALQLQSQSAAQAQQMMQKHLMSLHTSSMQSQQSQFTVQKPKAKNGAPRGRKPRVMDDFIIEDKNASDGDDEDLPHKGSFQALGPRRRTRPSMLLSLFNYFNFIGLAA